MKEEENNPLFEPWTWEGNVLHNSKKELIAITVDPDIALHIARYSHNFMKQLKPLISEEKEKD